MTARTAVCWSTLLEMAFASRCGLDIDFGALADPVAACFAEEFGRRPASGRCAT